MPESETAPADDVVVLELTGEVDSADVDPMTRLARDLLRRPGVTTLVADMTGLTFIDSQGLGLLVNLRGLAEDRGASFVLRNLPSRVSRLLELTGLLDYLGAE